MESDTNDKLDKIASILLLAFDEQLSAARLKLRADPVNESILGATNDWIGSADLQALVMEKCSVSERTVRNRVAELKERNVLSSRGASSQIQYKSSGIL